LRRRIFHGPLAVFGVSATIRLVFWQFKFNLDRGAPPFNLIRTEQAQSRTPIKFIVNLLAPGARLKRRNFASELNLSSRA